MSEQAIRNKFKVVTATELTDFDTLAKLLLENNPVYAIGVTGELVGSMKYIAEKLDYWQRVGAFYNDNKNHMTLHFVPVRYTSDGIADRRIIHARFAVVQEIFFRWTKAGLNARNAKSPFGCKSFNKFYSEDLDRIEYVIFLAPDEAEYDGLYKREA